MGLSIDVLVAGMTVIEVPCNITHRVTGDDSAGRLHRASQYKDVLRAVLGRRLRRHRVPAKAMNREAVHEQSPFLAYQAWDGPAGPAS